MSEQLPTASSSSSVSDFRIGSLGRFEAWGITTLTDNGDGVALQPLEVSSAVTDDSHAPPAYEQSGGPSEIYGPCESEVAGCYTPVQ